MQVLPKMAPFTPIVLSQLRGTCQQYISLMVQDFKDFWDFQDLKDLKLIQISKIFFSLFEKDFHGFKDYFKDLKATEGETWI